LGIPAIVGLGKGVSDQVNNGELVVTDPQSSSFIVAPDSETVIQAKNRIAMWARMQDIENSQKFEKAVTIDAHEIDVVCNIASSKETSSVLSNGGEGVGLLRTEFMFEASKTEPSVSEQVQALQDIVATLGSRQIVVRTADIGGDKPVSWMAIPHENNPFLGVRGIRLSFRYEAMFRRQLEAIYRVALWQQERNIKSGIHIMFPMIAKVSEWQQARDIAEQVRASLDAPKLPLGIMVEVPSAAILADHFAKEVDFFSIGSNDMTQYTLAIDRLHPELAKEADSFSPALLRLIAMTVQAAEANGKWVGVCGNMAADPDLACILIGLGVKELSVSPANVPALKLLIRSVSYQKLKDKAVKAQALGHSTDIKKLYQNRADLI
jgi:multiphosphoryl transfer protein